jgi:hypothetical protein
VRDSLDEYLSINPDFDLVSQLVKISYYKLSAYSSQPLPFAGAPIKVTEKIGFGFVLKSYNFYSARREIDSHLHH